MALSPVGIALQLRNFNIYRAQLKQVENITKSLSGTNVDAAKAVQENTRQLREFAEVGTKEAAASAKTLRWEIREDTDALRVNEAQVRQTANAWTILGAAMIAVGVPLLALTRGFVTAAAQEERLATAADVTTRARGMSTEALAAERKELEAMFVPAQRANRIIQQLAIAGVDAAKASDINRIAQDFSVASTLDAIQVQELFIRAITTGTTVRMREIGISVNNTRIRQDYADSIGKEVKELTRLEERLAVVNYFEKIGIGVQGAWVAQLDKVTGRIEIFNFQITRLRESLGKQLLPTINSILGGINSLLDRFAALPEPIKRVIAITIALSGAILTASGAFLILRPALVAIKSAVTLLLPLLTKMSVGSVLAGSSIGKLVTGFFSLHPAIKIAVIAIGVLVSAIKSDFGGLGQLFDRTIGSFLKSIKTAFVDSVPWIRASIAVVIDAITAPFKLALKALDTFIRTITGRLAEDGWGFEFDPESFFLGAASIMGGIAAGFIAGFNQFVLPVVISIVNILADFFGGSLPTEGPLAHIKTSGIEIIQAWSQGMKSVSLDDLRDLADEVAGNLQQASYKIRDALFDIGTGELSLDKILFPLEDALFAARAAADLVTIPLEQQKRAIEKQIAPLEEIAKIERERAEVILRMLEAQAEEIRAIIAMDQDRIDFLDQDIFIEQQRLKVLGKTTSARLLGLQSEKRALEDSVDVNNASLDVTEEQVSAEEKRLDELTTAAEAQIEALQAQIEAVDANIELENERVQLAQEALRLEEARQAQARLALLEDQRFWEENQRLAGQYLDIIGRIPAEVADKVKKAAKAIKDIADSVKPGLEDLFDFPGFEGGIEKIGINIDALKDKLKAAFMEPINKQLAITRDLIYGVSTGLTGGPEGEEREGGLIGAFERLKTTFATPLEIHFEVFPPAIDVFNKGIELGSELIKGVLAGLGIPGFKKDTKEAGAESSQQYIDGFGSGFTGGPIGELTGKITTGLDKTSTGVSAWITKNIPNLDEWEDALINWTKPLPLLLPPILNEKIRVPIMRWIFDRINTILTGDSPGGLKEWGQAFLDFPGLFVTPRLKSMLELITDVLLPWISPNAEERIIEDTITWGNAFLNWVEKDAVPFIEGKLEIFLATINNWVDIIGLPAMIENGVKTAQALIDGTETQIIGKEIQIEGIGITFVESLWEGIKSKWDWIKEKVGGFVQGLIDEAKKVLHIVGDPVSMVFKGIGETLAESLESGFESTIGAQFPRSVVNHISRPAQAVTNTVTNMGPTIQLTAQYSRPQSEASIRDDIGLMMALL